MPGIRAAFAKNSADRELHKHLGRAVHAVRGAMDVCGRSGRSRDDDVVPYRARQEKLARAERLLQNIGHLGGPEANVDMVSEARALCSWLEGRERSIGVRRPSRRGREYQERLQQVLGFLRGDDPVEDEPDVVKEPEAPPKDEANDGELWKRAIAIADQQGEGDNDAYIQAVFKRLVGGVDNG